MDHEGIRVHQGSVKTHATQFLPLLFWRWSCCGQSLSLAGWQGGSPLRVMDEQSVPGRLWQQQAQQESSKFATVADDGISGHPCWVDRWRGSSNSRAAVKVPQEGYRDQLRVPKHDQLLIYRGSYTSCDYHLLRNRPVVIVAPTQMRSRSPLPPGFTRSIKPTTAPSSSVPTSQWSFLHNSPLRQSELSPFVG